MSIYRPRPAIAYDGSAEADAHQIDEIPTLDTQTLRHILAWALRTDLRTAASGELWRRHTNRTA